MTVINSSRHINENSSISKSIKNKNRNDNNDIFRNSKLSGKKGTKSIIIK